MNKDKSSMYLIIGFFVAITGLLIYAYLMRDVTLPEDFMVMPENLAIEKAIVGIVGLVIAFVAVTFMSTPVKKV